MFVYHEKIACEFSRFFFAMTPMQSLDDFAASKLAELERASLRRVLAESIRGEGPWIERDGRRLLSFSCNDYLNLSHHPALKNAAIAAIAQYGVGAGASRLVTGNHPLFRELEERLARLKGTEAACVFGSGYLANTGIVPVLAGAPRSSFDRRTRPCLPLGWDATLSRTQFGVPAQRRCARKSVAQ